MRGLPLLAFVLLIPDALAAKSMSKDFLFCERRVECANVPNLSAPRNALLLNFQDADFTGPFAWIRDEKHAIIRGVNALLAFYGFPITAQEIDESAFAALRAHPDADVILKYRANSFLSVIGHTNIATNNGGTYINDIDGHDGMIFLFGPVRHPGFTLQESDIELTEIRPIRELGEDSIPAPRKAAMLAGIILHEFVHAAHHRAMGTVISGPPAATMVPACVVPYEKADKATDKFMDMLVYSRRTGHMAKGLMVAGQDHSGRADDEYGGGKHGMKYCLSDPRVPSALFKDLGALARFDGLCGPNDEDGPGFPVSDYFHLPQANASFLASYFKKMSAIDCYGGCYYRVVDTATAMKLAGYDPGKYMTLEKQIPLGPQPKTRIPEALPHDPRHEPWWVEANRQCAASDRRTASR